MAMSPNNDLVMGGGSTITLVGLYDILPSRYWNNARMLRNKLTSLRSCYEVQLRDLAAVRKKLQIAALTAELDYCKRLVAIKMDTLVAVRQELVQFPDVSHELVLTRGELRTSEAQTHHVHRYHNSQLRNIASAVAENQPKSPAVQHCLTNSGVHVEKTIIRTLASLNTEIQQTSTSIATYFLRHVQPPSSEEELSAARRASEFIPQVLVDRLRTASHHTLSLYLSIALQAYLTSHACSITSSWMMDARTDELLSRAYERLCKSESQAFAAGWRALIHPNIPICINTINNLISYAIQDLSDIVVAAGCAASRSNAVSKMSSKFRDDISSIVSAAENLREFTGSALTADFKVIAARPGQMFDDTSMILNPEGRQGMGVGLTKGRRVLCTTRLGLMKEVVQASSGLGRRHTLVASVMVKGAVVLREMG